MEQHFKTTIPISLKYTQSHRTLYSQKPIAALWFQFSVTLSFQSLFLTNPSSRIFLLPTMSNSNREISFFDNLLKINLLCDANRTKHFQQKPTNGRGYEPREKNSRRIQKIVDSLQQDSFTRLPLPGYDCPTPTLQMLQVSASPMNYRMQYQDDMIPSYQSQMVYEEGRHSPYSYSNQCLVHQHGLQHSDVPRSLFTTIERDAFYSNNNSPSPPCSTFAEPSTQCRANKHIVLYKM